MNLFELEGANVFTRDVFESMMRYTALDPAVVVSTEVEVKLCDELPVLPDAGPIIGLRWSYMSETPDLEIGDLGLSGTLRFHSGEHHVRLPWYSIVGLRVETLRLENQGVPVSRRIEAICAAGFAIRTLSYDSMPDGIIQVLATRHSIEGLILASGPGAAHPVRVDRDLCSRLNIREAAWDAWRKLVANDAAEATIPLSAISDIILAEHHPSLVEQAADLRQALEEKTP